MRSLQSLVDPEELVTAEGQGLKVIVCVGSSFVVRMWWGRGRDGTKLE